MTGYHLSDRLVNEPESGKIKRSFLWETKNKNKLNKKKQTKTKTKTKNKEKIQCKEIRVRFSKFSLRPKSHLKLLISIENNKNLCMRSNVGGHELTRFRFLSNIDRLISRN